MPPMATPSSTKRKWSDVFSDGDGGDLYDKQSLMDLCSSKLRYVNPARPPRRRTEVPLLRNVLIVNTMKHLSSDLRQEKTSEDYSTSEELTVDPGHFEGLPPLSELLTDIMLDPQPTDPHQAFSWQTGSTYSGLTPLQPSIPAAYMDTDPSGLEEEKVVHDLLPCTSVGVDHVADPGWDNHPVSAAFDCYLSSASLQSVSSDSLDSLASDLAFQTSSGSLPSFTSLFEHPSPPSPSSSPLHSLPTATSSYTDLTPVASASHTSTTAFAAAATTLSTSSSALAPLTSALPSNEELVGNTTLSEAELEVLAMAFSSKLPHVSFEELVHALPQSPLLHHQHSPYQSQLSSYYVPSSLQPNSNLCGGPLSDSASPPAPNNPCGASYCRKDQPQPSVDENMVRVLVNL